VAQGYFLPGLLWVKRLWEGKSDAKESYYRLKFLLLLCLATGGSGATAAPLSAATGSESQLFASLIQETNLKYFAFYIKKARISSYF